MVTRRQGGFTYMTVLFIVAILMGGLALIGEVWETSAMREKEADLLFVGNQYRKAIERYVLSGKAQYPRTLEDLLKDPRQPSTQRYLRKLYPDPMTGKSEWGLVKGPDGGIGGVYSLSEDKPLKEAGFKLRDASLAGAQKYSDWKFAYTPAAQPAAAKPAAGEPAQTK
ncbi:MAG TPA: type II secretion system protein [Burkholderiales bacterium]|nr:type II secretion system protein [Burkholderiales bacterium]